MYKRQVINKQGKVLSASNRINEVFIYDRIVDSDIFTLTGIKATDLYEIAISHEYPLIRRNEKIFKLIPQKMCIRDSFYNEKNLSA